MPQGRDEASGQMPRILDRRLSTPLHVQLFLLISEQNVSLLSILIPQGTVGLLRQQSMLADSDYIYFLLFFFYSLLEDSMTLIDIIIKLRWDYAGPVPLYSQASFSVRLETF